jgi:hypothetical protein
MTDREKKAKEYEGHVIQLVRAKDRCAWSSPPNQYANIDGITYDSVTHEMISAYEIKCRNLSLPQLLLDYGGELIVDASKVEVLQSISRSLRIPSYLLCYCLKDGVVLKSKITNDSGLFVCDKKDTTREISAGMDKPTTTKKVSHIKLDGTIILSTKEPQGTV